ncbi:iron-enterobactin ABC transporter permease [Pseudonocardia sp. TMWB2A]
MPGRPTRVSFGRRTAILRSGRASVRIDARSVAVCTAVALAVMVIALITLASGTYQLSLGQVVSALAGRERGLVHDVVVEWRLPQVAATVVFGAALGVSGAIFQSLMRNPLASPDVIGFSTGSYTGALIVVLVVGGSYATVALGALAGGIVTALAVYLFAYRQGVQGFRLIIVGIAVSAMLASVNTWLVLKADLEVAIAAAAWGAGSLNAVTWNQVAVGGAVILVLLVLTASLSRPMRQMELGDDTAASQGVMIGTARLGLIILGVALTATVTAAAGPIAFVALATPQIARRLTGTPGITLVPAAFVGALLLAAANFVAQHLTPTPLPVGVVTVMIGGTYLGWLLFVEARRRL